MRVVLKGVHKVNARLATGEVKTYYYAWRGGPQIKAKPGTPEFVREYHEAYASVRQPRAGTGSAPFTRERSKVRSLVRPPAKPLKSLANGSKIARLQRAF